MDNSSLLFTPSDILGMELQVCIQSPPKFGSGLTSLVVVEIEQRNKRHLKVIAILYPQGVSKHFLQVQDVPKHLSQVQGL